MKRDTPAGKAPFMAFAERVVDADPARVWALVADPMRAGEWAGVATVGYMGTELPKTGQVVFVRSRRWRPRSRTRRVEVQEWEAGSRYRCEIQHEGAAATCFELAITPEATGSEIATRIRITQTTLVPKSTAGLAQRYVCGQLERQLDRISKALT